MFELLAVIGAFFLYLLVVPLFGLIGGICLTALPYIIGTTLIFGLLNSLMGNLAAVPLIFAALVIWSVPVLIVRYWPNHNGTALNWYAGHYRASGAVMTFGLFARQREAANSVHTLKGLVARHKAG